MVCCTIIAALLALFLHPILAWRSNPLEWQLNPISGPSTTSGKAMSRLQSFAFALSGWRFLVRNEANMRIHLVVAGFTVLAGLILGISIADWRWITAATVLVLALEALNTAIEQTCNAHTREFNSSIKAAKDVAAGAVLLAAVAAALIGVSVFLPYVIPMSETALPVGASLICSGAH